MSGLVCQLRPDGPDDMGRLREMDLQVEGKHAIPLMGVEFPEDRMPGGPRSPEFPKGRNGLKMFVNGIPEPFDYIRPHIGRRHHVGFRIDD